MFPPKRKRSRAGWYNWRHTCGTNERKKNEKKIVCILAVREQGKKNHGDCKEIASLHTPSTAHGYTNCNGIHYHYHQSMYCHHASTLFFSLLHTHTHTHTHTRIQTHTCMVQQRKKNLHEWKWMENVTTLCFDIFLSFFFSPLTLAACRCAAIRAVNQSSTHSLIVLLPNGFWIFFMSMAMSTWCV